MSGSDPTTWNPLADEPAGGDGGLMGGFTFDLDRALAAVDAAPIATPAPAPLLITPAPEPLAVDTTPPALDTTPPPSPPVAATTVLPQRTPSTAPIAAPAVASPSQPTASPAPVTSRGSSTGIVPPGRRSLFEDAREAAQLAELTRIPTLAELTLPEAPPAPPPDARPVTPGNQPASPVEIRQFRTAQARRSKQNRKGRVFGRMMLALVLLGGSIAGALTVGRRWVFPTEWSDALAPLVAQLEASRGPGFTNVVPLVEQPDSEYAATVATVLVDGVIAQNLPVWRALGLASGSADDPALAQRVAEVYSAVYDPQNDRIVRRAGADDLVDGYMLAIALATAYSHHQAPPAAEGDAEDAPAPGYSMLGGVPAADLLGAVTPLSVEVADMEGTLDRELDLLESAARTSRDAAAGAVTSVAAVTEVGPTNPASDPNIAESSSERIVVPDTTGLPLPLRYQVETPAILLASQLSNPVDDVGAALDASLRLAPAPVLAGGETLVGAPVSLGIDEWTLVLANRLPGESVDRFVAGTVADAVATFQRGEVQCLAATFESANEMYAAATVQDLTAWAQSGPAAAQAAVTPLTPLVSQLVTCDAGPQAESPARAAIDVLLGHQWARLSPVPASVPVP